MESSYIPYSGPPAGQPLVPVQAMAEISVWLLDFRESLLQPQSTQGYKAGLSPQAKKNTGLLERNQMLVCILAWTTSKPQLGERVISEISWKLLADMKKSQEATFQWSQLQGSPTTSRPSGVNGKNNSSPSSCHFCPPNFQGCNRFPNPSI